MRIISSDSPTKPLNSFDTDELRWHAVVRRDARANSGFVYSVKTTGIYCRPTCPAKRPQRGNVQFHATAAHAERAGFRPCKRCKPDDAAFINAHAIAVARACQLIVKSDEAPDLKSLALAVGMSPSHFHRVFKSLTGLSPKAYAGAHRAEKIRGSLSQTHTVTSAIYKSGFKSSGRFYAVSSRMLGMRPTDFRNGGEGTRIRFTVGRCSLGSILVASSDLGICAIALGDNPEKLVTELQDRFSKAEFVGSDKEFERHVVQVVALVERPSVGLQLPLDVQGTAFQQRVWQELSAIPCGETQTYSQIARNLGQPKATRAVARACAANALAVAIPCHRAVRSDGSLAGYRWGIERKAKLLKEERSRM
jgi:AraC family transcriptional regulator of adaptative response/methylated-DNA-[protein]-cysteine methyltransferase